LRELRRIAPTRSSFRADVDVWADMWLNALARLGTELESGRWHFRNSGVLDLDEYDASHRLIAAEVCDARTAAIAG
jgi:hypothetical protein